MGVPCTLCAELAGEADPYLGPDYGSLIDSGANRLLEGGGLVVLPSVGALSPSHALVVPEAHVCSFALLPREQLAESIPPVKLALRAINRARGLGTIFFEHGMGTSVDTSGACVAHAHLHVLAAAGGVWERLREWIRFVKIPGFASVGELDSTGEGYVVFEDDAGEVWLANRPGLPPQFFRRVYAGAVGGPPVWNWRADPQPKNTRLVVGHYAALRTTYEAVRAGRG